MATPTKQQVAQAKVRAGGNNPIKVTNSGLKKLGTAAITAATFTPVGRSAKVAVAAAKPIAAAARNAAGTKFINATMGKKSANAYAKAAAKRTADRVQTAKDLKATKAVKPTPPKSNVKVVTAKGPGLRKVTNDSLAMRMGSADKARAGAQRREAAIAATKRATEAARLKAARGF